MKSRYPAFVLCLLLICSVFNPISLGGYVKNIPYQPVSSNRGNTLYVGGDGPDNYTRIQDAIDDALDGDTVFVYDDSSPYYELLVIDKSINLFGEDKNTTVIDGNFLKNDVVNINADLVIVNGFSIRNSGEDDDYICYGIRIKSNQCTVSDNLIEDNFRGVGIFSANNNIVQRNTLHNNDYHLSISIGNAEYNIIKENNILDSGIGIHNDGYSNTIIGNSISDGGIYLYGVKENNVINNNVFSSGGTAIYFSDDASNNIVNENFISNSSYGISFDAYNLGEPCNFNEITNNTIVNNQYGIELENCLSNLIKKNNIINNDYGIFFKYWGGARENTITNNNIVSNNEYGIKFEEQTFIPSHSNKFSRNNLIDNNINAYDWQVIIILSSKNIWNNNYYSDYKGGLVHFIASRMDLLFFSIPFFSIDWRPAKEPYDIEV